MSLSSSAIYHRLDQDEPPSSSPLRETNDIEDSVTVKTDFGEMLPSLGTFRAIYLVCLCSIGSFLFAYDTGIVGGVLTLKSFQRDFRYTAAEKTQVNSNCVSILQGGAFFGCFMIWPVANWLGRRWSIIISSIVFCIGAVLQILNIHLLGLFYAGRVISGLGTGGATVMAPMMAAEASPKNLRGRLGGCFQLFFATGVCVSYWVDYAALIGISDDSPVQWQIPVGLQLVPGGLLGLGMLFIKESPRWLAKKGRNEEAYQSLLWIRGGIETDAIMEEFQEILTGVQVEVQAFEGFTWRELLLPSNRLRMLIAISIQLAQQLTGNTSLAYFAPQFFNLLGTGNNSVFITGFFGIVKIAGVVLFITFFVDKLGRRKPLMGGALAMGILMLIVAIIIATNPLNPKAGISSAGAAGIAMIYLEAFAFNFSWGPCPWLYIGEIFPNRIREIGIATGAGSQWLFNFVASEITPHAVANIGWRTFLMFAFFNFANIAYVWFFIRETNGKSLEEMEVVFGTVAQLPRKDPESQVPGEGVETIYQSNK